MPLTGAFARFLTVIRVDEPPEDAIDIDSSLKETSTIASLSQFGSTERLGLFNCVINSRIVVTLKVNDDNPALASSSMVQIQEYTCDEEPADREKIGQSTIFTDGYRVNWSSPVPVFVTTTVPLIVSPGLALSSPDNTCISALA